MSYDKARGPQAKKLKVKFSDLDKLEVVLPAHLKSLGYNLTLVFRSDRVEVGMTSPSLVMDIDADAIDKMNRLPVVFSTLAKESKVKAAASLVATYAPNLGAKDVAVVGSQLCQVQSFLTTLDFNSAEVGKRSTTVDIEVRAKQVLEEIIPMIRTMVKKTVEGAERKIKFSQILEESNLPKDLVTRLISSRIAPEQDLIRLLYPKDPSKWLSFTVKQLRAGVHHLFARVLCKAAEQCVAYFLSKQVSEIVDSFDPSMDALSYSVNLPAPLDLKETLRVRNRRPECPPNPVAMALSKYNAVFTGPQWLVTGGIKFTPKHLFRLVNKLPETYEVPDTIQGILDATAEHNVFACDFPEILREMMFLSYGIVEKAEGKAEGKGPAVMVSKLEPTLEFKIEPKEAKVVKTDRKIPSFAIGGNPLGKAARQLVTETVKLDPAFGPFLKGFFTNLPLVLQDKAAGFIRARLESGIEEDFNPLEE